VATNVVLAFLAILAGIAAAVQAAANAGLAQKIGLGAALVVNTVVVLAGALVFFVSRGPHANFFPSGAPWSLYVGGFCGFASIFCLAFVFPKIGAAWAIALVVLGQCAAALVIDHYGLLGMPREPITLARAGGLVLVAMGFSVIRYREWAARA
jgi:transporter family-2 protein